MEDNRNVNSLKNLKKDLAGQEINQAYNSIGSNIFFGFGKDIEIVYANGRKYVMREWKIRIGNSAWRIIKDNIYVVGSSDDRSLIQKNIAKMLGSKFLGYNIRSKFMDIELAFSNGYKLATFCDWKTDDQWTAIMPNDHDFGIHCSSQEKIKQTIDLGNRMPKVENFSKIKLHVGRDLIAQQILYDIDLTPIIVCSGDYAICLRNCTFRLEKGDNYVVGFSDLLEMSQLDYKNALSALVEKKI